MMRRIFLALAAMLCLLSQNAPARNAQSNSAPAATMSQSKHSTDGITVPFEYFRRHIYVTVSLQGKSGFIFMVDSGANRDILSLRTSRQLGMQPRSLQQEKNIGFGDAPVYIAPEEDVNAAIGSAAVAHAMAVIDLSKVEEHFGHRADGILGYPFFRRFVVKLDYQRKLLSIFPADRYFYAGSGVRIALKPSNDFVILPVMLGSDRWHHHQIHVAVDTGSDTTMMVYDQFVRSLDLEVSRQQAVAAFALGLNGYYPVALGNIDSFLIGNEETHRLPVDYLAEDKEAASKRSFIGAIGNGILQNFRAVIFDVPHERMIFELKPPPLTPGTTRTVRY
ncbi:MAG: hypothetical protein ACYCOR_15080 [Acidobacteriaceae bacterium]